MTMVTATQNGGTANGMLLLVRVYTGASPVQNGPHGNQSGPAAHSVNITPTKAGSVLLSASENGNAASVDPDANNTVLSSLLDTTNGQGYSVLTSLVTGSGTGAPVVGTAFGCGTVDSFGGSAAAFELLPNVAGTAPTLDPSTPAVATTTTATTVTTADFTPPPGSVLIAFVSSNGAFGSSVTISLGSPGLSWTQIDQGDAVSNEFAGIWYAVVPQLRPPEQLGGSVSITDHGGTVTQLDPGLGGTSSVVDPALGGSISTTDLSGSVQEWTMQVQNLSLAEFNDETIDLTITANGVAMNLTGYTVNVYLKTKAGVSDTDPSTLKLSSAGTNPAVVITSATTGAVQVSIPNADLASTGSTFWRCEVVDSTGKQNTVFYGAVAITQL